MFNYLLISELVPTIVQRGESLVTAHIPGFEDLDRYYEAKLFSKVEMESSDDGAYKAAALSSFLDCNNRCRMINENFHKYFEHDELRNFLLQWRYNVHEFLKSIKFKLDDRRALTTGATSLTKSRVDPVVRYSNITSTSHLMESPLWPSLWFSRGLERPTFDSGFSSECGSFSAIGSKVDYLEITPIDHIEASFVLKSFGKYRVIWPEPTCNVYVNRVAGLAIADCINKTHLRIDTAADKHKKLACQGSIDGSYATGDYTSASDLIAFSLSSWLRPDTLQPYFLYGRVSQIAHSGRKDELHMTATMGCGFCWEWQTVVFYTFLQTIRDLNYPDIADEQLHAFGDDIIYPPIMHDLVQRYSSVFGWKMNNSKSFATGPFRESCGGDFLSGKNVRPVYARSLLREQVDIYRLYNRIVLDHGEEPESKYLRHVLATLVKHTPEPLRLYGPSHYGDVFFHSSNVDLYTLHGKNKTRISAYVAKAIAYTHIGKTKPTSSVLRTCISLGVLRGQGLTTISYRVNGKDVTKIGYPPIPVVGCDNSYAVQKVPFYHQSNDVDEMEPLSVFTVLGRTHAPRHLSVRECHATVVTWRLRYALATRMLLAKEKYEKQEAAFSASLSSSFDSLLSEWLM